MSKKVHSPKKWKSSKKRRNKSTIHRGESVSKRTHKLSRHRAFFIKAAVILIGGGILIGGLAGLGFFIWTSRSLPSPDKLNERVLAESTKIYDRTGENLLYEIHGDAKRTLIKLEELPVYTPQAFIAIEDKNFYEHKGFSLFAIFRTAITNVLRNQSAGGSTLTQQFVKNAILSPEKTYTRKIKEVILSYQIEKKFSKDEILQLYFNEIPFGSTAYGIEAAAQTYFAKSARDLTLSESAVLAAMIKAPTYYSPFGSHVDELLSRKNFVLSEMVEEGFITEEEMNIAMEQELVFERQLEDIQAPHFVLYVKELLSEQFGERLVEQGGLQVITSLDWDKQQAAEQAIADNAENNLEQWEATNASLVSVDTKTGEILAMVGSKDYFDDEIDGQVNIALRPRQPGSSFKPIVYMSAFSKGYLPETLVYDVETTFATETGKDYAPKNYDLSEPGPISFRQALQGSQNISAVKVLYLTGVQYALDIAEQLGYTTLSDRSRFGLSLVLGGGEVKLLEHVFSFATLAREGVRPDPVPILKVTDTQGKVWFEFEEPTTNQVVDSEPVRVLNNVLSDDNARSYVFGSGSLLTLPGRPVAAKTGTTNDYRDAWTIGYTPSIATGVWVGNNDNSAMKRGASGYTVAAPIWNQYMREATKDDPVEQFQSPPANSHPKPMLGGLEGSSQTARIDTLSGKLATEYTPLHLVEEKTFKDIHSILYFIDRSDPLGPAPSNPESDPQYTNWEEGIRAWAEKNDIVLQEQPPTEYDDIHLPGQQPIITIQSPTGGQVGDQLQMNIEWNTPREFQIINIIVDDEIVQTLENRGNVGNETVQIDLSNFNDGNHTLKAVVKDIYENSALDFVFIEL